MAESKEKTDADPVTPPTTETVESLKVIIVGLEGDKATLTAEISRLLAEAQEKDKQIIVLTDTQAKSLKEIEGYQIELKQAEVLLTGQKTIIDEQAAQIESLQASPSSVPVIVIGKKTYEVHAPSFHFRKEGEQPRTYTIEELKADKVLQAALVKKGVGFLVERS